MMKMQGIGRWMLVALLCTALAGSALAAQQKKGGKGKGKKKAAAAAPVSAAEAQEGFVALFDGKSLAGWEVDPQVWSVRDGMIVGKANMIKQNNFCATKKSYGDFILRVQLKLVDQQGNTGVQFRSEKIPNSPMMKGFQADFADVQKYCGMLYDEKRRGILVQPPLDKIKLNNADWNEIEVKAEGDSITISLNGTPTVEYTEKDPAIAKTGLIGLQCHAGKVMEVQFRNIRIKELKK